MGLQPENCYVVYDAKPFQVGYLWGRRSSGVLWLSDVAWGGRSADNCSRLWPTFSQLIEMPILLCVTRQLVGQLVYIQNPFSCFGDLHPKLASFP